MYAPLPCYNQSADRFDKVIEEIASIIHPGMFPETHLKFFIRLPEKIRLNGVRDQ